MNFLFHTIIEYDGVAVYYNVYRNDQYYFAKVDSNPSQVAGAVDFELYKDNGGWRCSISLPNNYLSILAEEIDNHVQAK
jgi:hypothetical protein